MELDIYNRLKEFYFHQKYGYISIGMVTQIDKSKIRMVSQKILNNSQYNLSVDSLVVNSKGGVSLSTNFENKKFVINLNTPSIRITKPTYDEIMKLICGQAFKITNKDVCGKGVSSIKVDKGLAEQLNKSITLDLMVQGEPFRVENLFMRTSTGDEQYEPIFKEGVENELGLIFFLNRILILDDSNSLVQVSANVISKERQFNEQKLKVLYLFNRIQKSLSSTMSLIFVIINLILTIVIAYFVISNCIKYVNFESEAN